MVGLVSRGTDPALSGAGMATGVAVSWDLAEAPSHLMLHPEATRYFGVFDGPLGRHSLKHFREGLPPGLKSKCSTAAPGEAQPSSSDRHCNASTGAGRSLKSFREEPRRKKYIYFSARKNLFIFLRRPSFFGFDSKQVRSLLELPPSLP